MQSEHLGNVHPGWVLGGWLVAIATTSATFLVLVGTGMVGPERQDALGFGVAVAVGFFAAGLFVGLRWSEAPILHAVALTLTSIVVLLAIDLTGAGRGFAAAESVPVALATLLIQFAAAALGGRMGRRMVSGRVGAGG
ncbi:MAG: hypothetical protein R3E98_00550 [Gemmatimonadota bacterium]|nr:hypothetical protein [Gemmatimonadota bacterium]